jgi:membrane-associated PAP2 superfamily phosphatase
MKVTIQIVFIFFCIALISQFTNLDLVISNLFYVEDQSFILQGANKSLAMQLHDYPKFLSMGVAILFWLASLSILIFKFNPLKRYFKNTEVLFVSLASILIPIIIWFIRESSAMHCPRDLLVYGGDYAYLRIFDAIPNNWEYGQCAPSAHASSFLWLSIILFIKKSSKTMWTLYYIGIFTLCSVQIMRGAHFFSHILYSFLIGHLISYLLFIIAKEMRNIKLNKS